MRIKVCGVTRPRDARVAVDLGAWAVGMIFIPDTPRHLALARARRVRAAIAKGVLAIGVFRRPLASEVNRVVKALRLDAVQIYGAVPRGIRARVIAVATASDRPRRGKTVLIEPARADGQRRSGRGPSDRARLKAWKTAESWRRAGARVILAGGLTADNAAEAAAAAKPWALDVSSGVENRPGIKSAGRMRAFFDALK